MPKAPPSTTKSRLTSLWEAYASAQQMEAPELPPMPGHERRRHLLLQHIERLFAKGKMDIELAKALPQLDPYDGQALHAYLRDIATQDSVGEDADTEERILFAVPISGTRRDLLRILHDEPMQMLNESCFQTGATRRGTRIGLLRALISPALLDGAALSDLAILTQAMATISADPSPDTESNVSAAHARIQRMLPNLQPDIDADWEQDNRLEDLMLLGIRMGPKPAGDLFDPDLSDGTRASIQKRWGPRMDTITRTSGLLLRIDPPLDIEGAMIRCSLNRLEFHLKVERELEGVTPAQLHSPFDQAHVCLVDSGAWVSTLADGRVYGPIHVPWLGVLGQDTALQDWISDCAAEVVAHSSIDDLPTRRMSRMMH